MRLFRLAERFVIAYHQCLPALLNMFLESPSQQYSCLVRFLFRVRLIGQNGNPNMADVIPLSHRPAGDGNMLHKFCVPVQCNISLVSAWFQWQAQQIFAGGATCRFFLVSSSIGKSTSILLTAQYYTRKSIPPACLWWAGNSVGAFFGDLVAYSWVIFMDI